MTHASKNGRSVRPELNLVNADDPQKIVVAAQRLLRETNYSGLRDVCCNYHERSLSLEGHVPTYYMKQMAQAVVSMVDGVDRIVNTLEVLDPSLYTHKKASQC